MKINQAVILAGGRGARLKPITNSIPKPMVEIHNKKTFLDYILSQLEKLNLKEIIILTGYKGHIIEKHYKKNKKVKIIQNPANYLTFKRLQCNYSILDRRFLLLYSDNFLKFNFKKYFDQFYKMGSKSIHLLLQHNRLANELGNVYKIKDYFKYFKRRDKNCKFVEMGYMIFNKNILKKNFDNNTNLSLSFVLEKYINNKNSSFYITNAKYHSITDIKSLRLTKKNLKKNA